MAATDVCLVNTPLCRYGFNLSGIYPMPHLGLGYLGTMLQRDGRTLAYVDSQFDEQNPLRRPDMLPDAKIFALTSKLINLVPTHNIAKIIREKRPDARIVLGGPCNIVDPDILFKYFPAFDIVATGEGEPMINPLTRALLDGKTNEELLGIPGLAVRLEDGRVAKTAPPAPANLTDEIYPLRTLWPAQTHRMHPPYGIAPPVSLMETARGCSFDCSFCAIDKTARERPDEVVFNEVRQLLDAGINEIHFVDPTFTLNMKRARRLCEGFLRMPRKFKWSCKTRVDLVNPELLKLMSDAGCYLIAYGIESYADDVLTNISKRLEFEKTNRALQWTHDAGIRSIGYILIGSPGESDRSVAKTNQMIRRSKVWFTLFGVYMPLPGSDQIPVSDRQLNEDLIYAYTYGKHERFAEVAPNGHPHQQLSKWLMRSVLTFYLDPRNLWRTVIGVRSFPEFWHYTKGAGFLGLEFGRFAYKRLAEATTAVVRFNDGHRDDLEDPTGLERIPGYRRLRRAVFAAIR
ncbi:MAG: radical SAM protein [Deltaproteobacteria bacterium]|nr:radical SAM protein [Deltaproteobacteria bacterium]